MPIDRYRLIGGDGERARARGLVQAEWYRSYIPRSVKKALFRRSDAVALRDTAIWYGLIALSGWLLIVSWGSGWAYPAFFVYATFYAGPADSRWHEAGHGTPFATDWMNKWLYQAASFQVMRRPTVWKWSHARHHTDTLITGRDQEIQVRLPIRPMRLVLDFFGFELAPREFASTIPNAFGYLSPEDQSFIPQSERARVVVEARAWLLAFAAIVGASIWLGSLLPICLLGLVPSIGGAWLYNFFGIVQHACLPENVLDHRLNSRTVLMNPVSRFLYWNMNYHVEHHMYPSTPYHALPLLHEAIRSDCSPPYPSIWSAYREFLTALYRQWRDPSYHVHRPLPTH
ncbi:MAG: fatty acid desaturase [Dongiaceae bacterium]